MNFVIKPPEVEDNQLDDVLKKDSFKLESKKHDNKQQSKEENKNVYEDPKMPQLSLEEEKIQIVHNKNFYEIHNYYHSSLCDNRLPYQGSFDQI